MALKTLFLNRSLAWEDVEETSYFPNIQAYISEKFGPGTLAPPTQPLMPLASFSTSKGERTFLAFIDLATYQVNGALVSFPEDKIIADNLPGSYPYFYYYGDTSDGSAMIFATVNPPQDLYEIWHIDKNTGEETFRKSFSEIFGNDVFDLQGLVDQRLVVVSSEQELASDGNLPNSSGVYFKYHVYNAATDTMEFEVEVTRPEDDSVGEYFDAYAVVDAVNISSKGVVFNTLWSYEVGDASNAPSFLNFERYTMDAYGIETGTVFSIGKTLEYDHAIPVDNLAADINSIPIVGGNTRVYLELGNTFLVGSKVSVGAIGTGSYLTGTVTASNSSYIDVTPDYSAGTVVPSSDVYVKESTIGDDSGYLYERSPSKTDTRKLLSTSREGYYDAGDNCVYTYSNGPAFPLSKYREGNTVDDFYIPGTLEMIDPSNITTREEFNKILDAGYFVKGYYSDGDAMYILDPSSLPEGVEPDNVEKYQVPYVDDTIKYYSDGTTSSISYDIYREVSVARVSTDVGDFLMYRINPDAQDYSFRMFPTDSLIEFDGSDTRTIFVDIGNETKRSIELFEEDEFEIRSLDRDGSSFSRGKNAFLVLVPTEDTATVRIVRLDTSDATWTVDDMEFFNPTFGNSSSTLFQEVVDLDSRGANNVYNGDFSVIIITSLHPLAPDPWPYLPTEDIMLYISSDGETMGYKRIDKSIWGESGYEVLGTAFTNLIPLGELG